jgi:hypothetical protein
VRRSTRERLNDIIESAEKAIQIRPADRRLPQIRAVLAGLPAD